MTPINALENYPPFSTMGLAVANDGSVWQLHPPSPGGMVQLDAPTTPTPPVNEETPYVTGSIIVGDTLNCTVGIWTNEPAGYTYQWQNDGVDISSATAADYTLQATDAGAMIQCVVTATNSSGSASATSNAVGPIVEPAANEGPPARSASAAATPKPHRATKHHARAVHR